jgi:uncharacterized membrane protein YgdD (TMEM256/DUF423 family)
MWWTYICAIAGVMGALGVGAGAFGSHALKEKLSPADLAIYETAVKYWMYHTLATGFVGLLLSRIENGFLKSSSILMILGSCIFSGSLIALVMTQHRQLGAITPIGGALLIVAWLLIAGGVIFA